MTDGNQEDMTKPLSESSAPAEKPVESEISSPQQDRASEDNSQLASGAPVDDNQSNQLQEGSKSDEGESKIEDSHPQETAVTEDGQSVQTADKPVEQVHSEPDKPVENEENLQERSMQNDNSEGSSDDKRASEVKEGQQMESRRDMEQQQDSDEKKDVSPCDKEQSDKTPAEDGDVINTSHTEQQGSPAENEQQENPAENEKQDNSADNEQQGNPAVNEDEGDSKPAAESENPGLIEVQQLEESQANEEVIKETLPNENSPDSETTPVSEAVQPDETDAEAQRADTSQEDENAPEKVDIKNEPSMEAVQPEATAAVQSVIQPTDELQDENRKLKQDIFMMKQQEDAYRIKVLSLEQEVGKLRARKIDNRSQDSLASDSDSYLKQKLAETERELDTAERKVKDLQLRLKRFAKDDQIKDEKVSQMEREVKELSDHVKKLEQSLADSKRENNNNATMKASLDKNDSKVCTIL